MADSGTTTDAKATNGSPSKAAKTPGSGEPGAGERSGKSGIAKSYELGKKFEGDVSDAIDDIRKAHPELEITVTDQARIPLSDEGLDSMVRSGQMDQATADLVKKTRNEMVGLGPDGKPRLAAFRGGASKGARIIDFVVQYKDCNGNLITIGMEAKYGQSCYTSMQQLKDEILKAVKKALPADSSDIGMFPDDVIVIRGTGAEAAGGQVSGAFAVTPPQ